MTVLTVGVLAPFGAAIGWCGYFNNILLVSVGNFIGGAVFAALPYYIISRKTK